MDNRIRTVHTSVATTAKYILKSGYIILDYTKTAATSSHIQFRQWLKDTTISMHKTMKTHITENRKSTTTVYSSIRDQSRHWLAFSYTFQFVLNWLKLVRSLIWTGTEIHCFTALMEEADWPKAVFLNFAQQMASHRRPRNPYFAGSSGGGARSWVSLYIKLTSTKQRKLSKVNKMVEWW